MNTVEDFKNAPLGATATSEATGVRAMKMGDGKTHWVFPRGSDTSDEQMAYWGYTLDPLEPTPTTAREALDLAWELAYEVKEGQVVPVGTEFFYRNAHKVKVAEFSFKITASMARNHRALDPLLGPEPDWLDALAVFAYCGYCSHEDYGPQITLHGTDLDGQKWKCTECQTTTDWNELSQVTPLYSKEGQEK